jgi:hypothetical protein
MKAYYYLAQAQISLNHPNEALISAEKAYELCLENGNKSASSIAALVLRAKKEKWDMREKARKRAANSLLGELETKLKEAEDNEIADITRRIESGDISTIEGEEEITVVRDASKEKIDLLFGTFESADPKNLGRRVSVARTSRRLNADEGYRRFQTISLTTYPSTS